MRSDLDEVFTRLVIPPLDNAKASDLRSAGYPEAILGDDNYHRWNEVHRWCNEHFQNRYTWCGHSFFFTNQDDMMLFAMRWS